MILPILLIDFKDASLRRYQSMTKKLLAVYSVDVALRRSMFTTAYLTRQTP